MNGHTWDYTAYEKLGYQQLIFFPEGQKKTWISMEQSFFWASKYLVDGVVSGPMREDIEGVAAVYLFRHFLELVLKGIILAGRHLTKEGGLSDRDEVEKVANIHDLATLWEWVLKDAKPKIEDHWDNFDWSFAEQCIVEFDGADKKGFAFRYKGHGGERAHVSMETLAAVMEHVYQVLNGILVLLVETRGEINDYLDILRSEAGW